MLNCRGWAVGIGLATFSGLMTGCGDECGGLEAPCDIAEQDCQERIFDLVTCVRNVEVEQPASVSTWTQDEFRYWLTSGEDEPPPVPEFTPTQLLLQRLDLLGEENPETASIDLLVESVSAFYQSRSIVIIDRDNDDSATLGKNRTLAHEYIHLIQDRTVGLSRFRRQFTDSSDSLAANRALTEGEAVWGGEMAAVDIAGEDPARIDWPAYFEAWRTRQLEILAEDPSPLESIFLSAVYPVGGGQVSNQWFQAQSWLPISNAYFAPRMTFLEWMPEAQPTTTIRPLECHPPLPPEGYDVVDIDRLGPLGLLALMVARGVSLDRAWQLAHTWRNGLMVVYADPSTELAPVMAWRFRVSNETQRQVIASQLTNDGFDVVQDDGQELTLWVSTATSALSAFDQTECATYDDLQTAQDEAQTEPDGALVSLGRRLPTPLADAHICFDPKGHAHP